MKRPDNPYDDDNVVKVCSNCGQEAKDGEMFSIFIDPDSDWWLTLFDSPPYCQDCVKKMKE